VLHEREQEVHAIGTVTRESRELMQAANTNIEENRYYCMKCHQKIASNLLDQTNLNLIKKTTQHTQLDTKLRSGTTLYLYGTSRTPL
jgi:hypothetical protein